MPNGSMWFLEKTGVDIFDGQQATDYEDSNWYWNFVDLAEMIPTIPYKQTTVDFELGDLLLSMTFSITEPRNAVRYDVRRIRAVGSNLI